jgi:hypothetical protein
MAVHQTVKYASSCRFADCRRNSGYFGVGVRDIHSLILDELSTALNWHTVENSFDTGISCRKVTAKSLEWKIVPVHDDYRANYREPRGAVAIPQSEVASAELFEVVIDLSRAECSLHWAYGAAISSQAEVSDLTYGLAGQSSTENHISGYRKWDLFVSLTQQL